MTTVSQEDYLKAIWGLTQEGLTPISARLSDELNVSPPAVTTALRRMKRNGYVRQEPRGEIRLTAKGRRIAEHLSLRHRLAEKLLTEVLGMPWTQVHEEAEKLEHAISPELEKRLLSYFGREGACPHGNPLFGGLAKLRRRYGARRLSTVGEGQTVQVLHVYEKDVPFLEFLDRHRLRPGRRLVVKQTNSSDTMEVELGGEGLQLGRQAAERIWVRLVRA
ncbi:MAG: metal-dependent transcriptional regulator [Acidobacteria bacterium]|nr:metal-dependent transcriptional regulator [Acidobacteriota bacterium]